MNIYLLQQDANDDYDTYDSMVVIAASSTAAKKMTPGGKNTWADGCWANSPDDVKCTYLGKAAPDLKSGSILESFNAG